MGSPVRDPRIHRRGHQAAHPAHRATLPVRHDHDDGPTPQAGARVRHQAHRRVGRDRAHRPGGPLPDTAAADRSLHPHGRGSSRAVGAVPPGPDHRRSVQHRSTSTSRPTISRSPPDTFCRGWDCDRSVAKVSGSSTSSLPRSHAQSRATSSGVRVKSNNAIAGFVMRVGPRVRESRRHPVSAALSSVSPRPRAAVVGGGFAGLAAARELRTSTPTCCCSTATSTTPSSRSCTKLRPARSTGRCHLRAADVRRSPVPHVRFQRACVIGVDPENRRVRLDRRHWRSLRLPDPGLRGHRELLRYPGGRGARAHDLHPRGGHRGPRPGVGQPGGLRAGS